MFAFIYCCKKVNKESGKLLFLLVNVQVDLHLNVDCMVDTRNSYWSLCSIPSVQHSEPLSFNPWETLSSIIFFKKNNNYSGLQLA